MKTRISILAAGVAAAFCIPVAGAMIPADPYSGYGNGTKPPQQVVRPAVEHVKKKTKKHTTATKTGYDPYGYVPGGASQKVANAITAEAMRAVR
jgi:hypothetical protein